MGIMDFSGEQHERSEPFGLADPAGSIRCPALRGFILLALWLQSEWGWGQWVLWVGIVLGVICAIDGFRSSIKAMERLSKRKDDPEPPAVSFNDHD